VSAVTIRLAHRVLAVSVLGAALLGTACGDDADPPEIDAASALDSAEDGNPWAGFPCGTATCARGTACCTTDGVGVCIAVNMTCGGDTTECDGPEDCLTAPECCEGQCLPPEVSCTGDRLCHADPDCASGGCCPTGVCGPGC